MAETEVNAALSVSAPTHRQPVSESARLQRDVERFTGRLETERRLSLILDEDIRAAKEELRTRQLAIKDTYKQQKSNSRDQERVSELETLLDMAKRQTSDLVTSNVRLRSKVDSIRKGNLDSLTHSRATNQQIQSLQTSVETVHTDLVKARRTDSVFQTRIYRLQDQWESDRTNASMRVESLEREIREDRKQKKEIMRRLNLSIAQTHTELSESGQVTKNLYEKWVQRVQNKRKEFTEYLNFIEDIEKGLGQMKDISGLDDYDQVVRTMLNALERQREIQNHLIKLTEQIENIKAELKVAQNYIVMSNSREEKEKEEMESRIRTCKMTAANIENSTEKSTQALKEIRESILILSDPVRLLKGFCHEMDIIPEINPSGLSLDEEFTMDSAGLHLLALEEALTKLAGLLKTSKAVHSEDAGFTFLTEKRFDRGSRGSMDISSILKDETLLVGEEESHPLNPAEFRQRAERVLGSLSM